MENLKEKEMLWFSKNEVAIVKNDFNSLIGKEFFIDSERKIKKVLLEITETEAGNRLDTRGVSYDGYYITFNFEEDIFKALQIYNFMKYNEDNEDISGFDIDHYCKSVKDL